MQTRCVQLLSPRFYSPRMTPRSKREGSKSIDRNILFYGCRSDDNRPNHSLQLFKPIKSTRSVRATIYSFKQYWKHIAFVPSWWWCRQAFFYGSIDKVVRSILNRTMKANSKHRWKWNLSESFERRVVAEDFSASRTPVQVGIDLWHHSVDFQNVTKIAISLTDPLFSTWKGTPIAPQSASTRDCLTQGPALYWKKLSL